MKYTDLNAGRVIITTLVLALMLVSSVAFAIDKKAADSAFEIGWVRYRLKDYQGAIASWKKAAVDGNTKAIVSIAHLYRTGEGVNRDLQEARKLYAAAMALGDVEAKHNLASMYLEGDGVGQDIPHAVLLYSEAAEQGYVLSQQQLGLIKYNQKKYREAEKWWSLAANGGNTEAQYHLALLYLFGTGVAQDDKAALILMREAAKGGHPEAQKHYQRFLDINKANTHSKE